MASSFGLQLEMHSVILRGVKKLRDIELVHEAADQVMLDARMTVAGTLDDQFDDEWAPSPEEIVAACNVIQSDWSDEERERRGRFEYTSTRTKRYVADFKHLKQTPARGGPIQVDPSLGYQLSPSVSNRNDKYKRYRERHRERILAQRQDPAYKEKKREEYRRYAERNKLALKERQYAKRDQYNAARKAADDLRREEVRACANRRYAARRDAAKLAVAGC